LESQQATPLKSLPSMTTQELAQLLSDLRPADSSLSEFLRGGRYSRPLLSQRALSRGTEALCQGSQQLCRNADFILPESITPSLHVRFSSLRTALDQVVAPLGVAAPRYVVGPPGLGKTLLAYTMGRVVSEKTGGRLALFHVNGAIQNSTDLFVKRVAVTNTANYVRHCADYELLHPHTQAFLMAPHEKDSGIERADAICSLPQPIFTELVNLLHTQDRWDVPPNLDDWQKDLLGVPVITPLGALVLPKYELGPEGRPIQRDNVAVMLVFDEFHQCEDQKAAAVTVGVFSDKTAQTGNPFLASFPSGWLTHVAHSGRFNHHRFLFACGNDPELSGGDDRPMDALFSRLFPHQLSLPPKMGQKSVAFMVLSSMLSRVRDKTDTYRCAPVDELIASPQRFEIHSDLLKSDKEELSRFVENIVQFEEYLRSSIVNKSLTSGDQVHAFPRYLDDLHDYLSKYAEQGWGNVLNARNLVNTSHSLARLQLSQEPQLNERLLRYEVVRGLAGVKAADAMEADGSTPVFMNSHLPSGISFATAINDFVEAFPVHELLEVSQRQDIDRAKIIKGLFDKRLQSRDVDRYNDVLASTNMPLYEAMSQAPSLVHKIGVYPGTKKHLIFLLEFDQAGTWTFQKDPLEGLAPTDHELAAVNAWLTVRGINAARQRSTTGHGPNDPGTYPVLQIAPNPNKPSAFQTVSINVEPHLVDQAEARLGAFDLSVATMKLQAELSRTPAKNVSAWLTPGSPDRVSVNTTRFQVLALEQPPAAGSLKSRGRQPAF